jgi:predicted flap endonuclease-1-like 5' DNA nuclease
MAAIADIEGIGDTFAQKLKDAGVSTVEGLLEKGATPKGRADLVTTTGISDKLVLKWVNHADLFRIKGVAGEFAELLEASGVDTVAELAQRNGANLAVKMAEVNESKKLTRAVPSESQVSVWITEAKGLPRMVSY